MDVNGTISAKESLSLKSHYLTFEHFKHFKVPQKNFFISFMHIMML